MFTWMMGTRLSSIIVTSNLVILSKKLYHIENLAMINEWVFEQLLPRIKDNLPSCYIDEFEKSKACLEERSYLHLYKDVYGYSYFEERYNDPYRVYGSCIASIMVKSGDLQEAGYHKGYNKHFVDECEDRFGRKYKVERTRYNLFETPYTCEKAKEILAYACANNDDVKNALARGLSGALPILNEQTKV